MKGWQVLVILIIHWHDIILFSNITILSWLNFEKVERECKWKLSWIVSIPLEKLYLEKISISNSIYEEKVVFWEALEIHSIFPLVNLHIMPRNWIKRDIIEEKLKQWVVEWFVPGFLVFSGLETGFFFLTQWNCFPFQVFSLPATKCWMMSNITELIYLQLWNPCTMREAGVGLEGWRVQREGQVAATTLTSFFATWIVCLRRWSS